MKQVKALLVLMACVALAGSGFSQSTRAEVYDMAAVISRPIPKTIIDRNSPEKVKTVADSLLYLSLGFRCDSIARVSEVVVMVGREKGSGEIAKETISIYKEKKGYRQKDKKSSRLMNKNAVSYACHFNAKDKARAQWVTVYCHYRENGTSKSYYYKLN